ncbi:two-component system OmpR family sensor kinase [Paraperlucidibaca baekdonensis]|uniref:histidine kinase n=1 Tax=Paraperlucidibaca baekdonensis TaxID=748120 RepID=A0A3E0H2X3_9GAMM|nr:ATP-binding protein [Paraperlucidibaca baekdonensis]REH37697.1 two-component system OmpR family sensor kinase [Paraperlucidibaca baekdonensis]
MGRLFWKLLLGFWLALISASVIVGVAVNHERDRARAEATQALLAANPELFNDGVISPDERRQWRQMRRELRLQAGLKPPQPPGRQPYWLGLIGLLASLAFSAVIAWYLAKPIRHLRHALHQIAHGDLDTRVAAEMDGRRDELADLGVAFDQMATQLQQQIQAQKRLLHDVSHELRSPLARLQMAIGIAQQSPEALQASLRRIGTESERLDTLIGELLTLSRLENPAAVLHRQSTDLSELVASIVDDARYELGTTGTRITFAGPSALTIMLDETLIGRAIENIIRNAVKFGADGSMISVYLSENADAIQLSVRDGGPGLAEADLSRIFEPFYRGESTDKSRQRSGYGLGLAIAQHAVKAHGGSLTADNIKPHGLSVMLTLPKS